MTVKQKYKLPKNQQFIHKINDSFENINRHMQKTLLQYFLIELTQYGSLSDKINKRKCSKIATMLLLFATRGLTYIHLTNGRVILFRPKTLLLVS